MPDHCYDPCNACGHTHHGRDGDYRCPRCTCNEPTHAEKLVNERNAA